MITIIDRGRLPFQRLRVAPSSILKSVLARCGHRHFSQVFPKRAPIDSGGSDLLDSTQSPSAKKSRPARPFPPAPEPCPSCTRHPDSPAPTPTLVAGARWPLHTFPTRVASAPTGTQLRDAHQTVAVPSGIRRLLRRCARGWSTQIRDDNVQGGWL